MSNVGNNTPIRKSTWDQTDLGELARDLRALFGQIPQFAVLSYTGTIVYPFAVSASFKPQGVIIISAVNVADPVQPVAASSLCTFTSRTQTETLITAIQGFTPTAGAKYALKFLAIG